MNYIPAAPRCLLPSAYGSAAAHKMNDLHLVIFPQNRRLPVHPADNHLIELDCDLLRLKIQNRDQVPKTQTIFCLSRLTIDLNAQGFCWTSGSGVYDPTKFSRTTIGDSTNNNCCASRVKVWNSARNHAHAIAAGLDRKDLWPESSTQYP